MTTPSKEFQQIAAAIPADFNVASDDVATVRAKMKPWHGHPIAKDTQLRYTRSVAGNGEAQDLAWLKVADCDNDSRYAFFCHGGGFVSCTAQEYLFFAEHISRQFNCTVAVPDYRLAPEAQYPAALDDCLLGYQSMLEEGVAAENIVFTGDSCGGGLAACALIRARDEGLPLPSCFVGLTGWFDLQLSDVPVNEARTEPMITPGWYRNRVKDYLLDADPTTAYASAAFAEYSSLPPLLLQVGSNDLSLGGARQFAENAKAAGVNAHLDVYEGMVHGFHGLISSAVPESLQAWSAAREFVDRWIAPV